jgi:hypothetical protein
MPDPWIRCKLTAELLADAHFGTGSGGGGVDALVARDRHGRPVIWASHVEGVLRDAARKRKGEIAAKTIFGEAGGQRQRAIFTSLYTDALPQTRIWRSAARHSFANRAPKDDTLRAIEYVPKGTRFVGYVELPKTDEAFLRCLVQEVDALGSGRAAGAGRLRLSMEEISLSARNTGTPTGRLRLLLENRDPLCITATATPDNLIPSLAFVPGRTLLGALANWLITEDKHDVASLLTTGSLSVSDALPLPHRPPQLESVEVLPAPLSLQSKKPVSPTIASPWWAEQNLSVERIDAWTTEEKLKRPEDDLFLYRASSRDPWIAFRPALRVRLRNGRPDPNQPEPALFAIEQIAEETCFLAEVAGSKEDMERLVEALAPVLEGRRWLRVGRGGAPVEVVQLAWLPEAAADDATLRDPSWGDSTPTYRLILTSDLLVRDELLRWRTALDEEALRELVGSQEISLARDERGRLRLMQDTVMVHGFNGTSRLWRMPAAAIRRGSVFEVTGPGVAELARRAAQGKWLGERTHEGFGRFRLDLVLPGVNSGNPGGGETQQVKDVPEEAVAEETRTWFHEHQGLASKGRGADRKPSLSQWFDLVNDLERGSQDAISSRLNPATAGGKSWKHKDAQAVLKKLNAIADPSKRAQHARFFVRWLRAAMRKEKV